MNTSTFVNTYESNTAEYKKLIKNKLMDMELQGKIDHSLREYRRESLVFTTLNMITMITVIASIGAYKYLSTK
jgi:hypothetical protein